MNIKLIISDGCLCTPHAVINDPLLRDFFTSDPILLVRSCEDCDTISWPNPDKADLAESLYDARETGVIPDCVSVILPDGTEFVIDANL